MGFSRPFASQRTGAVTAPTQPWPPSMQAGILSGFSFSVGLFSRIAALFLLYKCTPPAAGAFGLHVNTPRYVAGVSPSCSQAYFYEAVQKFIESSKTCDRADMLQRCLHFLSESGLCSDKESAEGTHAMYLLLSSLSDHFKGPPYRFLEQGVRAGTILIDTFKGTDRFTHLFWHCKRSLRP